MTDREKLIALLENASYQFDNRDCGEDAEGCEYHCYPNCWAQFIADHLIANGVTIQRWIPVEERLPEPFVSVLVHMPLEEPMPTVHEGFLVNEEKWYAAHFDRGKDEISHWMPMPEPPIEEQKRAREGENDG